MSGGLVAGIGFRKGTGADEIADLLRRALAVAGRDASALAGIATVADRATDPALREAAARFGLVPLAIDAAALVAADDRVATRSARIVALRGVGSVAEAAALAAAGAEGRLALPRIASAGATCALATFALATCTFAAVDLRADFGHSAETLHDAERAPPRPPGSP